MESELDRVDIVFHIAFCLRHLLTHLPINFRQSICIAVSGMAKRAWEVALTLVLERLS
jgi:hypothetical protein